MKEVIYINRTVTPVGNKVLVEITDTYNLKQRKSGVLAANAAHEDAHADSPGFMVSEFIIRSGIIIKMPRMVTTVYDWQPENEFDVGDEVFWPILRFFNYPVLKMTNGRTFLLVDYFDIHLKRVDGKPVPVNGFYLFTQEKEKHTALDYAVEKVGLWYKLEAKGNEITYVNDSFNNNICWEIGETCLLNVPPFKLEADTSEEFDKQYFLAQKRHILLAK